MDKLKLTADSTGSVLGEEFAEQMAEAERVIREHRDVLRKLAKDEPQSDIEEPVAERFYTICRCNCVFWPGFDEFAGGRCSIDPA
jgi:hypothetical protein